MCRYGLEALLRELLHDVLALVVEDEALKITYKTMCTVSNLNVKQRGAQRPPSHCLVLK